MHNDTTTSANSTPAPSAEQLMLFPEASHASHTAAPESASANPMIAICGPKCLESFARLPRAGSWAKTFAGLLLGRADWYSKRCRLIWRLRGTRYRRSYFLLQVSTRRTKGTVSGLLPTVTASNAHRVWQLDTILKTVRNGHETKLIYMLQNAGMSGKEIAEYMETFMGYPKNWTELKDSETP